MPAITEANLKDHLRAKSFANLYFLYGEEGFLVKTYVKKIKDAVVEPAFADFNYSFFDGSCTVEELADFVQSMPLMAPMKCAVIKDFDADERSAKDMDKLYALLTSMDEGCVAVFYTDLIEIGRKPSAKWKKFIKAAEEAGHSLYFPYKDKRELCRTLIAGASKRDCSLDDRLADYMIDNCGQSLEVLIHELDKICSFTGSGDIKKEQLEQTIIKSLDASAFDMVKAVVKKDCGRAFAILDELFYQKQEPVAILGALSMAYVDMYRVKAAVASGERAEAVGKIFEYKGREFRLRNAAADASRVPKEALRKCLALILQADERLKSTRTDKRVVMEQLIVRLAATCQAA